MSRIFAGCWGFSGLSLLKFGNPVIMEKWVTPPLMFTNSCSDTPGQSGWAYRIADSGRVAGLFCIRRVPEGCAALAGFLVPLAWLVWEFLSGTQSSNTPESRDDGTFRSLVACFYLGIFLIGPNMRISCRLVGAVLRISRGAGGWLRATLRRIASRGVNFFPLCLTPA